MSDYSSEGRHLLYPPLRVAKAKDSGFDIIPTGRSRNLSNPGIFPAFWSLSIDAITELSPDNDTANCA